MTGHIRTPPLGQHCRTNWRRDGWRLRSMEMRWARGSLRGRTVGHGTLAVKSYAADLEGACKEMSRRQPPRWRTAGLGDIELEVHRAAYLVGQQLRVQQGRVDVEGGAHGSDGAGKCKWASFAAPAAARAPAMLREVWAALKETAVQTYWLSRKNLLLLVRRLIRIITYRTVAGREAEPHSAHRARPCLDIIPILSRKRRRLRLRRPRITWLTSLALPPPDRPHVLRLSSALDGGVSLRNTGAPLALHRGRAAHPHPLPLPPRPHSNR